LGGFQSSVQHKLSLCRGPLCRRLTVRLRATTVEVFDAAQLVIMNALSDVAAKC
jgi:hypothetical protein